MSLNGRDTKVIPLRSLVRDQGPGAPSRGTAATAVGFPTLAALTIEGKCALLQKENFWKRRFAKAFFSFSVLKSFAYLFQVYPQRCSKKKTTTTTNPYI